MTVKRKEDDDVFVIHLLLHKTSWANQVFHWFIKEKWYREQISHACEFKIGVQNVLRVYAFAIAL